MKANTYVLFLLVGLGSFSGCGDRPSWTTDDKQNVKHLFRAFEADLATVRISNRGAAFSTMSSEEVTEILRLQKEALDEARAVHDEVLSKAHPDLPQHFRDEFEKGLELKIRSIEFSDAAAGIRGAELHDRWVDWYSGHRGEIKIPK